MELGLPWWLSGKKKYSLTNAEDMGSIPHPVPQATGLATVL